MPDKIVAGVSMLAAKERTRDYMEKKIRMKLETIESIWNSAELLEAAGIRTGISEYSDSTLYLRVEREQLPTLHRALGKMKVMNREIENARKHTLRITLKFENHPHVQAYYIKKMPKKTDEIGSTTPRCKIVRRTRVEHVLVCENPNG